MSKVVPAGKLQNSKLPDGSVFTCRKTISFPGPSGCSTATEISAPAMGCDVVLSTICPFKPGVSATSCGTFPAAQASTAADAGEWDSLRERFPDFGLGEAATGIDTVNTENKMPHEIQLERQLYRLELFGMFVMASH